MTGMRVIYTADEISAAIDGLAAEVNRQCSQGDWLVICVMNGGLMFTGALMQKVDIRMRLDSVRVSRYHETTAGSDLKWHTLPESGIAGEKVLLLDDIFDEGKTLAALSAWVLESGAEVVLSAVLVEKAHDRKVAGFRPDFVGLTCEDLYVFGYGMDYEGFYRNLPDIRCLDESPDNR